MHTTWCSWSNPPFFSKYAELGLATLADFVGKSFEQGVLIYTRPDVLPFRRSGHTFYALPLAMLLGNSEKGVEV